MDQTHHVLVQAHELIRQLDASRKAVKTLGVGVLFPANKDCSRSYMKLLG